MGLPKSDAKWIATMFPIGAVENPPVPCISVCERKIPSSCPGWMKGAFVAPILDGFMRRGCEDGQFRHFTASAVDSVPRRQTPSATACTIRGTVGTVPTGIRIIRAPPVGFPGPVLRLWRDFCQQGQRRTVTKRRRVPDDVGSLDVASEVGRDARSRRDELQPLL